VVICLERGIDCLPVVQLMPLHPKTPSSIASFKFGLVLPFRYRLTQAVLEKRLLNGCSSMSIVYSFCDIMPQITSKLQRAKPWVLCVETQCVDRLFVAPLVARWCATV